LDFFVDVISDAFFDTLRLIPFLFVTYWAMEALERHAGSKAEEAIQRADYLGPLVGGLLGAVPQCGFSAAASTLYAGRVISVGTLLAVFLSTSDEMLPIFIAEQAPVSSMLEIIGYKILIGIVVGFSADGILHVARHIGVPTPHIHELCERDHCGCEEGGSVLGSATIHTLQVTGFIFLVTLILDGIITYVGMDAFASFVSSQPVLSVFASALVGLIPNCAASVIITQLYLEGVLGFGAMMAGLLVAAGIGLLVLMRTNRHVKENLAIIITLYIIGIAFGLAFQALGVSV
jgi:hypothetical protein